MVPSTPAAGAELHAGGIPISLTPAPHAGRPHAPCCRQMNVNMEHLNEQHEQLLLLSENSNEWGEESVLLLLLGYLHLLLAVEGE